jgi:hypothetical protein
MIQRADATREHRMAIRNFLASAARSGFILVERDAVIPQPLSGEDEIELIDRHFGIDRAQLQSERAALLTPGADCACGD